MAATETILYFDCYSGISGDMTLGAMLDLGLELKRLQEVLDGLDLGGYSIRSEKVSRGGLAGTRAVVGIEDGGTVERDFSAIESLIKRSDLPPAVAENSIAVFRRLAEAEAAVHGIPVEQVHFHEVGAIDAIVDIVGAVSAIYLLGIDRIYCSPLPAARGEVNTGHGRLPLPAPATLELLAAREAPLEGRDLDFELVTPTGAAIVATLAEEFGPLPAFNLEAVGYGAGSHDPGYPNFLRLLKGSCRRKDLFYDEDVLVIETNIDDLNPEVFGYLMEKLFDAGALDVYFTAVQMKKNRPAVQLTILSPPEKLQALQDLVFYETSTLGLRVTTARKIMRPREVKEVQTRWGPIRIKYSPGQGSGLPMQFSPEYEDCLGVAGRSGLPLKEVYRLAELLFRERYLP